MQAKTGFSDDRSDTGELTTSSHSLELVSSPVSRGGASFTEAGAATGAYIDQVHEEDPERESRQLKRALVHATVFLARAPLLIEEAIKAVQARDEERLRLHARTLRRCAWHVTRGRLVRSVDELDLAAGAADFERADAILQELAPEFSLVINRLSQIITS